MELNCPVWCDSVMHNPLWPTIRRYQRGSVHSQYNDVCVHQQHAPELKYIPIEQ